MNIIISVIHDIITINPYVPETNSIHDEYVLTDNVDSMQQYNNKIIHKIQN